MGARSSVLTRPDRWACLVRAACWVIALLSVHLVACYEVSSGARDAARCEPGSCDAATDAAAVDGAAPRDARVSTDAPDAVSFADAPLDASTDGAARDAGADRCAVFASEVVSHRFGTGQDFNQREGFPHELFGPPDASRTRAVVSLGNGGEVVLGFGEGVIVDGPGVDLLVFENPLPGFVELATVAVSVDGHTWHAFLCDAPQSGPDYGRCAGVGRVHSSPSNGIDPRDPSVAGGDAFDLAELGLSHARYVRITDREDLEGIDGVFDLDAVAIVHARCGALDP